MRTDRIPHGRGIRWVDAADAIGDSENHGATGYAGDSRIAFFRIWQGTPPDRRFYFVSSKIPSRERGKSCHSLEAAKETCEKIFERYCVWLGGQAPEQAIQAILQEWIKDEIIRPIIEEALT